MREPRRRPAGQHCPEGWETPSARTATRRTVLRALSADTTFLAALRNGGFRARVHSMFARVVNLATERGNLYTLASRALDDAPDTMIVDVSGFAGRPLHVGELAVGTTTSLAVGAGLEIAFDACAAWEPSLPCYPADDGRLASNLAVVRDRLAQEDAVAKGTGVSHASSAEARIERHAVALCAALGRGDTALACSEGRALVGLGPGLTPSGDDFLVGLFAVLNVADGPCQPSRDVCTDILSNVRERTHAISVAALQAAARGRVRDGVRILLCDLLTGSEPSVRRSLARVLAIGSTSGRDIVRGMLCGLEAQLARNRCATERVGQH